MPEKKALLIIDVQNDFMPGGTMGISGGESIIDPINNLMQQNFTAIIATVDWHPADHCSFILQGGPWPVHCVRNSPGAELAPALNQKALTHVIHKGLTQERDSYSAFFDNDHRHSTGLNELLRNLGVTHVTLCGLALDYCVAWTARDALALGFAVSLVQNACRAIAADATTCLTELCANGVTLTESPH